MAAEAGEEGASCSQLWWSSLVPQGHGSPGLQICVENQREGVQPLSTECWRCFLLLPCATACLEDTLFLLGDERWEAPTSRGKLRMQKLPVLLWKAMCEEITIVPNISTDAAWDLISGQDSSCVARLAEDVCVFFPACAWTLRCSGKLGPLRAHTPLKAKQSCNRVSRGRRSTGQVPLWEALELEKLSQCQIELPAWLKARDAGKLRKLMESDAEFCRHHRHVGSLLRLRVIILQASELERMCEEERAEPQRFGDDAWSCTFAPADKSRCGCRAPLPA